MLSENILPEDTLSEEEIEKDKIRKKAYESARSRIGEYGRVLLNLAIPIPDLFQYSSDKTFYILDFVDTGYFRIYLSKKGRRGKKEKLLNYPYGSKNLIPLLLSFEISAKGKYDVNPVNKEKFGEMIFDRWCELENSLSSFGWAMVRDVRKLVDSARFQKFYEILRDGKEVKLKHPVKEVRIK